jgi:F-type H+-transporting ATPase subunit a
MQHVTSHRLFGAGGLYITNHILMMLVAAALMVLVFAHVGRHMRNPVPRGLTNFFEAILSYLRTDVFRPVLGDNCDRFTPFLWTVFFFILFCNLLGLVPIGAIPGLFNPELAHWGGTATGNISVTAGLAVFAFIVFHVSGIVQNVRVQMDPSLDPHHSGNDHIFPHGHGGALSSVGYGADSDVKIDHTPGPHAHGLHAAPKGKSFIPALFGGIGMYIWTYAPHPDMGPKWLSVAFWFVLLCLEMISTIVKPFSLCVRLFANMLAGHLVLGALVALVPLTAGLAWVLGISTAVILGSAAVCLLELFEAFLQAYIFVFLTTLFIAAAVAPEH